MADGRRRNNKTYIPGVGWTTKKLEQDRDYSEYTGNESWALLIAFFRYFPDLLLDLLRGPEADYPTEELIQRVMMRAFARYQYVDITGCRGLTKTSSKLKQKLTFNLVWPCTKSSYYGPSYKQMAPIASKTFQQIRHDYPELARHWEVKADGVDRFELVTELGSSFSISAYRGDNINDVTAEEYAQEELPAFDYEEYKRVVLPAIRLVHRVGGKADPTYPARQQHSITSAGRKQNHAYETRCAHMILMSRGESAFVMDVPWQVVVLSQIRPLDWAKNLQRELTPEEWMRECESHYTGADSNPVVRDEVLSESRKLMVAENRHCATDLYNKIKPEDVWYIVGYDVSYRDDKKNAKCACVVVKCTKQKEFIKRDRFLKQVVYVDMWEPPVKSIMQAQKIKDVWSRFCCDEGNPTYLAIDAWQYGTSVLENLMTDLGDGLAPLCIKDHADFTNLELDGAIPCIYPVKAGGPGTTDPDSEMVRYAEMQFENRNIELLCQNVNEGVEAYKKYHRIKDDYIDAQIAEPYMMTRTLVGQIQNLKKVPAGGTMKEQRLSNHIQRDIWSALKYALRVAEIIEKEQRLREIHKASPWDAELKKYEMLPTAAGNENVSVFRMRGVGRQGGRRF